MFFLQDKIKIIFSDFGEVIKVFSPRNKNFAYVTYSKYEEAEEAINQLHDKPPLFLKLILLVKNVNYQ